MVARAELLRHGITVLGPEPASLFAPVDAAALRAAARAELTGFWAGAVAKPHLWTQDVYVDLGLLTVVRVEATLTEDRMLTKAEALTRLDRFGVPPGLVEEMTRRRAGEVVVLTDAERVDPRRGRPGHRGAGHRHPRVRAGPPVTSRPEPVRSFKRRASRVTAGQRTALDRLWPALGVAVDGSAAGPGGAVRPIGTRGARDRVRDG